MNQPRRVPWASLKQLEQLYLAIYTSKDYEFAINRLAAWKYAASLPQSLDATLALLVATNTDLNSSKYAARQGYALAIIRFVNGVVDPLQVGVFARSIAAIATQVELPLSLVELRHACTHEELPSLEALRDGSKLALSWLEQRYFRPTLAQNVSLGDFDPLPTLQPLLKQYKQLVKQLVKDSSLKSVFKDEIISFFRALDIWVAETTAAIWKTSEQIDTENRLSALNVIAYALTQSGGLVPVAKKKQPTTPTASTENLWSPLLVHLQQKHPEFGTLLSEALISVLTIQVIDESQRELMSSGYYLCLSGWLLWVESHWNEVAGCDAESIAVGLLKNMPREDISSHIIQLTEELKRIKPSLGMLIDPLLTVVGQAEERPSSWTTTSLEQMQQRLDFCQTISDTPVIDHIPQTTTIKGWKLLNEEGGWKPCPIGY